MKDALQTSNVDVRYVHENAPNADRLVDSLRYLGYDNYGAIADLVDNALDADATEIRIAIRQRGGEIEIILADNGGGMDQNTLDQAMRLGSRTERNAESDLGKFGMGLVTASLSMAKRLTVITTDGSEVLSSEFDVDVIRSTNEWTKSLGPATDDEQALFNEMTEGASTGTVVWLRKCDNLSNTQTTSFANYLKKTLGRIHRYFLMAGREIWVNGDAVRVIDPLELSSPDTEIFCDEDVQVEVQIDGETVKDVVRVILVIVSAPDTLSTFDMDRNMRHQGFYLMRNQREILESAPLFDWFTKHNDFNRFRGEIHFSGRLDRAVGVNFTKRQVTLQQGLADRLSNLVKPNVQSIRWRLQSAKTQTMAGAQKDLHEKAAKTFAKKDKLLLKPKAQVEKRGDGTSAGTVQPKGTGSQRVGRSWRHLEDRLNLEFREERLGPNGQIFECHMEGRKTVVRYNIEHPFYQRFIVDNLDQERIVTGVDFLIGSFAYAELRVMDADNAEILNNLKMVLSANMRTLLS